MFVVIIELFEINKEFWGKKMNEPMWQEWATRGNSL